MLQKIAGSAWVTMDEEDVDMGYLDRLNNVYMIDTKMFGFDNYMSAYLVKGAEIAMIDTGLPTQIDAARRGIKEHGFSVGDISHIFITHSHPDHSGNVAPILEENPLAKVYIHPMAVEQLIDPSIELAIREKALPPRMHAKIGEMEPVAPDRIVEMKDGQLFDLGHGERLKAIFAPGHQPDGVILYEEKHNGLFINDLVGNYFPDADAHYPLSPPNSNHKQTIESLQKALEDKLHNSETINLKKCLSKNDFDKLKKENLIVLIKLGKTSLKDLSFIKVNSKAKIYPIV